LYYAYFEIDNGVMTLNEALELGTEELGKLADQNFIDIVSKFAP